MALEEQNNQALLELSALIEKVEHGTLDISLDLYRKKIVASTVYGKKRNRYRKGDNNKALEELAGRLQKSISNQDTTTITFNIKLRKGSIEETMWYSDMVRKYEE